MCEDTRRSARGAACLSCLASARNRCSRRDSPVSGSSTLRSRRFIPRSCATIEPDARLAPIAQPDLGRHGPSVVMQVYNEGQHQPRIAMAVATTLRRGGLLERDKRSLNGTTQLADRPAPNQVSLGRSAWLGRPRRRQSVPGSFPDRPDLGYSGCETTSRHKHATDESGIRACTQPVGPTAPAAPGASQ